MTQGRIAAPLKRGELGITDEASGDSFATL
jgi:hypothetical protein